MSYYTILSHAKNNVYDCACVCKNPLPDWYIILI